MSTDDSLVRTIVIVIAAILLLPLLMMALMMPFMGMWGAGHMGDGMWNGAGGSWLWILTSLIPLVLIVGGGYLLYGALQGSDVGTEDAALEELRVAYARGELSDEEFEERRERLRRDR